MRVIALFWVLLLFATCLTRLLSVDVSLQWSTRLSTLLVARMRSQLSWPRRWAEFWLMRLSRITPQANCMDRAVALQWYGACMGHGCQVIVGFRQDGDGWAGHAWLLWDDGVTSFVSPDLVYKEVWRT